VKKAALRTARLAKGPVKSAKPGTFLNSTSAPNVTTAARPAQSSLCSVRVATKAMDSFTTTVNWAALTTVTHALPLVPTANRVITY